MNKKILISIAASAILGTATYANSTSLGEVTVTTATKSEKAIDGVTASVIVVTEDEIKKTGASTLDKILEKIPSINAQFGRFPHPSSKSKAAISLRGVGANGTLILVDGKRLSGETESPYEMSRISASMIERIEIVKGSMSTLYGSDAIGGVINIITKKIDKNETTIDVKYGSNDDSDAKNKNINFTTRGSIDSFRYKVYGSVNKTTPFRVNKAYNSTRVRPSDGFTLPWSTPALGSQTGEYKVTYKDESTVKTIGTRLENDFSNNFTAGIDINYFTEDREGQYLGNAKAGVGGLVTNTPVNSKDENRRVDLSADIDYEINDELSIDAKIYRSYYKKRNFTDPINFDGETNKKFSANVTFDTFESNLRYELNDSNFITTGLEYRKEKRESSAINPNPSSFDFITKEVKYKSLFIQDEIEISDTLNATIGARYDNISNADNKVTFQAGLVQKLGENSALRANYAQGYRAPDTAELFVVAPYFVKDGKAGKRYGAQVENPGLGKSAYDLKPEQSETFELSLSNRFNDDLSSNVTVFYNKIKDKIELVEYNESNDASRYFTSENIDKVDIKGAEVSVAYRANDILDFTLNATYLDTEDKSTGKELAYTPDISASLSTNLQVLPELSTNANIRYIGKQYKNSANSSKTDSYSIVDLSAQYVINDTFELYGGIDNIFDKEVEEELGVNVGRYFYTGIRVSF